MSLHRPTAGKITNPFGTLSAANIAGSLFKDAAGPLYASFSRIIATGWKWYPKTTASTPTPHQGTDYAGAIGAAVVARAHGKVVYVGTGQFGWQRGLCVLVVWRTQAGGWAGQLAQHLSKATVTVGQVVNAGQEIGHIGTSGQTFGSHLHDECRYTSSTALYWTKFQTWRAFNGPAAETGGRLANTHAIQPAA